MLYEKAYMGTLLRIFTHYWNSKKILHLCTSVKFIDDLQSYLIIPNL